MEGRRTETPESRRTLKRFNMCAAQFLVWAAHDGDRSMVELLLSRGVSIDEPNGDSTALNGACAGGQTDLARFLVSRGADTPALPEIARGCFLPGRCDVAPHECPSLVVSCQIHPRPWFGTFSGPYPSVPASSGHLLSDPSASENACTLLHVP